MKFKKFFEAPWVDTPDHGTFDMGLELLNKDKRSLIQRVRNIFLGKEEFGAHGSRIKLDTMEEKEKFKQELLDDVIFLSYSRKVFGVPEQQIIRVIDNAIKKSELVRTEETTRDNTHDRDGVVKKLDQHYLKSKQDIKAINRMPRPYGKNLEGWEDIKEEELDERIKPMNWGKYLTNPKFRRRHRDATMEPTERDTIDDNMRDIMHKHNPVTSDIGELSHDEYYFSPEYKEKMKKVIAYVLGNEDNFQEVMSDPEKKNNFTKIYNNFKKNVKGGLSGVLKAIGISQPAFLQTEGKLMEDYKIFGITIESVEEKVKELLKNVSEEAIDRKYEAIGHTYPEEAEDAVKRSMKLGDLGGALVHKGAEKALDFEIEIEEGIKKAIIMLSKQIDMLFNEHQHINQIISYFSDANLKVAENFIRSSFNKGELEWVVLLLAVKELMKETQKVSPGAYHY